MSYIKQGTPEWHELRKKHIGASDSASVLGCSPWKTPYQLWQEKLGLYEVKETEAMRRGKELEAEAREYYSGLLGEFFVDDVRTSGIFLASLDGINLEKTVAIEIKCPNMKRVVEFGDKQEIPLYYYSQLQHQMYVYNLMWMHYAEYHPGYKVPSVIVKRDDGFINIYIQKAMEFWNHVQNQSPPDFTDKDYVERDDQAWKEASNELKYIKNKIKSLIQDEEYYKEILINLADDDHCNVKGCGITLSKTKRSGGIDYESMPRSLQIEVDKYRKKESEFWTVRIDSN